MWHFTPSRTGRSALGETPLQRKDLLAFPWAQPVPASPLFGQRVRVHLCSVSLATAVLSTNSLLGAFHSDGADENTVSRSDSGPGSSAGSFEDQLETDFPSTCEMIPPSLFSSCYKRKEEKRLQEKEQDAVDKTWDESVVRWGNWLCLHSDPLWVTHTFQNLMKDTHRFPRKTWRRSTWIICLLSHVIHWYTPVLYEPQANNFYFRSKLEEAGNKSTSKSGWEINLNDGDISKDMRKRRADIMHKKRMMNWGLVKEKC